MHLEFSFRHFRRFIQCLRYAMRSFHALCVMEKKNHWNENRTLNKKWQIVIESAVRIAASTIHFLIQFQKFYFLSLFFALPLFGLPTNVTYTKLYHFTFDTRTCVLVYLSAGARQNSNSFLVHSFSPQMLILFASWHKVDLTFLIARCMRQLSGRFFFAIVIFHSRNGSVFRWTDTMCLVSENYSWNYSDSNRWINSRTFNASL